jgi:predicted DNA-binding transcriptional regulator YafY
MIAAQLKDAIEETQSTRTLYRDLEVLELAGFPLTNEDGRWRLLETSESSWAILVNPTEVVALMLTEDLLAPVEGSWLAEPLANLRARLSATLIPTGRRYCAELRKTNVATVFGNGHYGERRAELESIHEAIEKQYRLRITYATPRQAPRRTHHRSVLQLVHRRPRVRRRLLPQSRRHPHLRGSKWKPVDFGGDARVVAPKELVEALKALHRRGLEVAETTRWRRFRTSAAIGSRFARSSAGLDRRRPSARKLAGPGGGWVCRAGRQ